MLCFLGIASLVATVWLSMANPIFCLMILVPLIAVSVLALKQKQDLTPNHLPIMLTGFIPWGFALLAMARIDLLLTIGHRHAPPPAELWIKYLAGLAVLSAFCWFGYAVTLKPRATIIALVTQFCIFVALSAGAAFMLFAFYI